jgi:hypothetical protein
MGYQPPLAILECQAGCRQFLIYRFDLLWHGVVVESYVAPINQGGRCWWSVTTLGIERLATDYGSTPWQDLVRLTKMPDVSRVPPPVP